MIYIVLKADTPEFSGLLTQLHGMSCCDGWAGLGSQAFCHVLLWDRKVWVVNFCDDMFMLFSACIGPLNLKQGSFWGVSVGLAQEPPFPASGGTPMTSWAGARIKV